VTLGSPTPFGARYAAASPSSPSVIGAAYTIDRRSRRSTPVRPTYRCRAAGTSGNEDAATPHAPSGGTHRWRSAGRRRPRSHAAVRLKRPVGCTRFSRIEAARAAARGSARKRHRGTSEGPARTRPTHNEVITRDLPPGPFRTASSIIWRYSGALGRGQKLTALTNSGGGRYA